MFGVDVTAPCTPIYSLSDMGLGDVSSYFDQIYKLPAGNRAKYFYRVRLHHRILRFETPIRCDVKRPFAAITKIYLTPTVRLMIYIIRLSKLDLY